MLCAHFVRVFYLSQKVYLSRLSYLGLPVFLYFKFVSVMCGIDMSLKTSVGPGLIIDHGFGLVVSHYAVIGSNVRLRNGVVLGVKAAGSKSAPILGDFCDIGAGAVVLGGVYLGRCAIIGANSVVLSDVPNGEIWAGNPAKKI